MDEKKAGTRLKLDKTFGIKENLVRLSIGDYLLKGLSIKDRMNWDKKYNKTIKEFTPEDYIKSLLPFILFKDQNENKEFVNEEKIAKLSQSDLELIINSLVGNSPSLNRKDTTEAVDEEGVRTIKISYGDIEIHKLEGESLEQYFYRLKVLEEEKESKRFKELGEKLKGTLNFSQPLNDKIIKMMSGVTDAQSALEKLNLSHKGLFNNLGIQEELRKMQNFQEIPKSAFHVDLNTLKDYKLESLRSIDEQMNSMSEKVDQAISVMTLMLNELKGSSDGAGKNLKIAVKSLMWTIGLSVLGLIVSSVSLFHSFNTPDITDVVSPQLSAIEKAVISQNKLEERKLKILEDNVRQNQSLLNIYEKNLKISSKKMQVIYKDK